MKAEFMVFIQLAEAARRAPPVWKSFGCKQPYDTATSERALLERVYRQEKCGFSQVMICWVTW
jgi:hypothetical protein